MRNYRQEFPDFSPVVYLNCASQAPFPRATVERLQQAIELKARPDRLNASEYVRLPDRVRMRIARLTSADPEEIAITNSATQGIGIVSAGLTLGVGDEVVVANSNFPSNLFTWVHLRRKGVIVKVVHPSEGQVTLDQVAAVLSPRTRVLALDWVSYSTGYKIDLAAFGSLIHSRGGIFVIDGTQGVGANELNLHETPVDVMACAAYKWLLGPYGTGFAYVRRDLWNKLDLPVINWLSVKGAENFDSLPTDEFSLIQGARVFDSGETANFINVNGWEASLEFVEEVTIRTVNEYCLRLLHGLAEGLRAYGYTLSSGALAGHNSTILGFCASTREATAALHQRLLANHIVISLRQGMIRVSPYLYNNDADIDRLLEIACPE
jgi:selenocysteine lyase/cysteine desulfurase